ncbi:MAG: lantibiotic dehydratase [Nannocystaceae bacterium]
MSRRDFDARGLEVAPAAVVRVASTPIDAIDELAAPEVATLAGHGASDRAGEAEYLAAYDAAIERTRRRLWDRSAGDRRFRAALAVANPALAESLPQGTCPELRNKRTRHLETSLYRYVARSAARTEPCGLWAGVALASWGPTRSSAPRSRQVAVAPDLAPIRALFLALRGRPAYREAGPYKLNPTLLREGAAWIFWAPGAAPVQRSLRSSAAIDAAITALGGDARWTLAAAGERLAAITRAAPEAGRRVAEVLLEQGVLVGGLAFPTRFASPWEALIEAERRLQGDDRQAFAAATLALSEVAHRLEIDLSQETCDAEPVIEAMTRARGILADLALALEVPELELPRAPLRVDLKAPFELTLGPADRAAMSAAIADFSGFLEHQGIGGALSPALTRRWIGDGAASTPLATFAPPPILAGGDRPWTTWEVLAEGLADPALRARVAAWDDRLRSDDLEIAIHAGAATPGEGAPMGSLLCAFGGPASDDRLVVRGVVRDATPAFARHAHYLEPAGDGLTAWLRGCFDYLSQETGVEIAELVHDHPEPGVLARPALTRAAIDLWGAGEATIDARGAALSAGPGGAVLCRIQGRARPLAIHAFSAAVVPPADPSLHLLLLSSMRTPPQIPRGDRLAFAVELAGARPSPRVALEDGPIVRTRRMMIDGERLRGLVRLRGAARFRAWQAIAAEHRWAERLLIHRDEGAPLLVHRDAPLAIEAAFEGAAQCRCLMIEEMIDDAWICTDSGERHLGELVLPFLRREHLLLGQRLAAAGRDPVDPAQYGADAA